MTYKARKADKIDGIQYWAVDDIIGVPEYFEFECIAQAYARLMNKLENGK